MPPGDTPAAAAAGAQSGAERLNTRAAGVVGLAVLCSRVLGLAREQIFAALFGGGRVMDAFTIAFRIPNLLRDLFGEGALSTAFVTVFTRTAALEGDGAAWRLANKVASLTAVCLSAITVLGIITAPWLVAALAPGFDPGKAALTVTLTRVMYPFILLVSLAALVMGMLNARNVFGIPAMASSFFNLGSIVAGVVLGYWLDPQLGDGPTFWLTGAFRLMQLPLGVFGVALGTVALPLLTRMAASGNTAAFRSELARGMRLAFLMTIPASVGLMVLAEPIISVLYQHGRFGAHETAESAAALRFYAIGLCGYAALKVLVNAFYALDKRKTPMVVSFFAVALNLLLNWMFTLHFGWGHRGLAFSTACVATSNFLILYFLMRSHLGRLESRAMLALLWRVALASAVLLGICWAGAHFLLADWAVQRFWPKCVSLLLVIGGGGGAFFLCASALGIGEVHEIVRAMRRRLHRVA